MNQISKSAFISKGVKMGVGNTIAENVVIDGDVTLGDNNYIGPGTLIKNSVKIGNGNTFTGLASCGIEGEMGTKGDVLDKNKFIVIGDNNKIREFVTIHAPVRREETSIGNGCYLMSRSHVAHDCILKDKVVLATNSILGGGTTVERSAYIGLGSVTHQWLTIGAYAMIGMNAVNTRSVAPFTTVAGIPARVMSLNVIGAQRNGFEEEMEKVLEIELSELLEPNDLIDKDNRILVMMNDFYKANPKYNKKLR